MYQKSLSLIFIFFSFVGFSQKIIEKQLESTFLETTRNLRIYIPEGYEKDSIKNFPLAIVLDEESMFDIYVGNSVLFSKNDKAPRQIIVGISMEKSKNTDISFDRNNGKLTTTARNFYEFIRDEVLFYMESTYRTSPFITLVGHGYSANLITHFLKEENPIFNAYICINTSFSDFIGAQLQSFNWAKIAKEDTVFYYYLNTSNTLSSAKQAQIEQIQKGLSSLEISNFKVIADTITTSNVIAAIGEAIPRAFSNIFEIYVAISEEEFNKSIKELSPLDAIAYLENKYLEIEFLFGSSLGIRERDIYAIEKIIIEKENGDRLLDFGKMILKLYPSSHLGDYYIGKYYETGKNIKRAITHYKIGYGKMDPADPNADAFYENILRLGGN
jgi:predicted alpha/beta superfamily hydrolase